MYGLTVVLFTLLLSAGMSSYFAERAPAASGRGWLLLAIPLVLLAFGTVSSCLTMWFQALDNPGRIAIAVLATFPMGLVMGTAFPLGMKLASERSPSLTPWLWGINGATSVLASVIAVVIAMSAGITASFWVGFGCYAVAGAALLRAAR